MYRILMALFFIINFLQAKEKTDITLQLNWLNQFQFAGYYIAKEKGFYKEAGLNVTINELKDKKELLNVIKNGKADFAIGRSSLLINKVNGEDIVALAAIFQHSPLILLTTNIDEIHTIKDMKNKKIMITPDAELTASITAMLHSNNIFYKDLQLITHSFNLDDLISQKTDLMASYISNEPIKLKEKGIEYKIFHPKDFGFDFYSDILFTSSKFIKENPDTTNKFYEQTIRGWEYAFKNKTEAAELIYSKYNTQNKSLITLIKEADTLEKLAINKIDKDIGCLDKEKLEKILNTFNVLGLTKGNLDLDSFIYEKNHHKTFKLELAHDEKTVLFMFSFFTISIVLIILYFFNKIHAKRKLLTAVLNSTDDLVYYKDKNLKYLGCNNTFEKFIGKTKEEILGKDDYELFDKKIAKEFRKEDLKILASKTISVANEWININGEDLYFQSKRFPLKYNVKNKIGVLGVSRDITKLYKIQKKLEEQAIKDELTNAFNRKSYNEKIKEHIEIFKRYDRFFCVALLDIDNFKDINDTFGHDIGDDVLIELCNTIRENLRSTDELFRIGGEEFIILYPETSIENAHTSIEKIRELLKEKTILEDRKVTISIGLTQIHKEDDEKSIFKRVDEYMYFSKNNGKDKTTTQIK